MMRTVLSSLGSMAVGEFSSGFSGVKGGGNRRVAVRMGEAGPSGDRSPAFLPETAPPQKRRVTDPGYAFPAWVMSFQKRSVPLLVHGGIRRPQTSRMASPSVKIPDSDNLKFTKPPKTSRCHRNVTKLTRDCCIPQSLKHRFRAVLQGGPDPQRKPKVSFTVTPYEIPQIRPPHSGLDPWRWLRKQVLQLLQNHSLRRPFLRRHA